jgi:hypothetical protein
MDYSKYRENGRFYSGSEHKIGITIEGKAFGNRGGAEEGQVGETLPWAEAFPDFRVLARKCAS